MKHFILITFALFTFTISAQNDRGLKLFVDDVAKDFSVKMTNGKTINLSDYKGKVVLLNFWATWCGPCLMEFNEIPEKILTPFENKDFVFIPISRGESEKLVQKKLAQLKSKNINFEAGIDSDKKIWDMYATKYIPKNFVIDKNGVIKFILSGYSKNSVDVLAKEIKKLLKK